MIEEKTKLLIQNRSQNITLLLILLLCAALLMINISQPWVGLDGTAGVKRSIEAKNFLRYGFFALKFGQANTYYPVSNINELTYYQHHPPLTSIAIAISFFLFGVSEISYRIVFILFTLGSVVLLFQIVKRCYGEYVALIAAFIFSILPVTTFFGRSNYEPITQFFMLFSVLLYLNWLEEKKSRDFYIFLIIYSIALLTDWPVYFLGGILPVHYLLSEKAGFSRHKKILLIPIVTAGMFGLFLYYSYMVRPDAVKGLFLQGKIYIGAIKDPAQISLISQSAAHGGEYIHFTAWQFGNVLLNRFLLLYLYPVMVLNVFGFWRLLKNLGNKINLKHDLLLLALLFLPAAYSGIFYRSTFIHWVWIFYFGVPFAILAALGIDTIFAQDRLKLMSSGKWRLPMSYLFLIVLIILPALSNLKELHSMQRKVLPGDQHESVKLIIEIGHQLKSFTNDNDLILTNLTLNHEGLRGGPIINYYAERRIGGNIDEVSELDEKLKQNDDKPVYFYLWAGKQKDNKNSSELENFLMQRYPYSSISLEGYEFKNFKIR